ncbi:MAG: NnrS family protein [Stenotrophobium sp.]
MTKSAIHPFRPLFLCAAGFASLGMLIWGLFLHLGWRPAGALPPPLWHGHAMLFGFAGALIGGFLLTAAANWTGLRTTTPATLMLLVGLWLAARIAMFLPDEFLDWAAGFDLAYLLLLALLVGRVLVRANNRRNLFVIGILLAYALFDLLFFAGARQRTPLATHALLLCVDLLTLLMLVIGGRVIPFFTGRRLPRLRLSERKSVNVAVNVGALLVLLADAVEIPAVPRGVLSLVLAVVASWRLLGWRGWACRGEPMLWVLHLGYLWLVIGLAIRGLGLAGAVDVPEIDALHGITVGALGTLSIGMMTRVAQGHSGADIRANRWLVMAFLLPSVAAVLRLAGGAPLWPAAATAWTLAFALYLAAIGPLLLRGSASKN